MLATFFGVTLFTVSSGNVIIALAFGIEYGGFNSVVHGLVANKRHSWDGLFWPNDHRSFKRKPRMSYAHLTAEERETIAQMHA